MLKFSLFFGLLGLLSLPVACGDDDDDSTTTAGGTCEDGCDHQAAAGCSKTPQGYVDFCKQECAATRQFVASSCQAELRAYEACQASARYVCVDDQAQIEVSGVCGNQAIACANCNGGKICSAALQGLGD